MEYAVKRIGVLTSGGDAPGMNAAIRAVARTATRLGIECVGIRRGWNGLINGDILPLDAGSVRSIINRGGTMLYTARSEEFRTEEGPKTAANTCKLLGLDGLVAIGGDGTSHIGADVHQGVLEDVVVVILPVNEGVAGTAVAMANAVDSVKQKADIVTKSNNENGVCTVLNDLLSRI